MAILVNILVIKGLLTKIDEESCELATSAKMAKLLLIYQSKVTLTNCFSINNKGMRNHHKNYENLCDLQQLCGSSSCDLENDL